MRYLKHIYTLLNDTIDEFNQDRAIKHGAAIAYYTIFALPPILIIIVRLTGSFLGEQAVRNEILSQISAITGAGTAAEVQAMMENIRSDKHTFSATVLSIATLLFGATGVFYTLQDSLNMIWHLHTQIKPSFLKIILDRLLSFAMVVSLGFILMVSMILQALLVGITTLIDRFFGTVSLWVNQYAPQLGHHLTNLDAIFWIASAINLGLTLLITTGLFAMVFRFLPDAKIHRRDLWLGSLFTATLFVLGEFAIGWYIGHSNVASAYGAAGSVIVILIWVFYSAQIVLLGAEFMDVHARSKGRDIKAADKKFGIAVGLLSFRAIYAKVRAVTRLRRAKRAQKEAEDEDRLNQD